MDDRVLLPPAPWMRVLVAEGGEFHALPPDYSAEDDPESLRSACGFAAPPEGWPSGREVVRLDAALERGLESCPNCLLDGRYGPPRCRVHPGPGADPRG